MRLLVLLSLFFINFSCTKPKQTKVKSIKGNALGTTYSILYYASAEENKLEQKVFKHSLDSIFKVVNKSLSTYLPTSDISKIKNGDTTVVVDHMFKDVFNLSKKIYTKTDGYFDPTVGKMVNAWGFGPEKYNLQMTDKVVDSLMQYVGFDKVKLTTDNKIIKTSSEVYLDFNAIAKGYCIDRIGEYLNKNKVNNYLIELGGELLAKGNKPENKPWIVGVDDPNQTTERNLITTLKLFDAGMATSGNYRKFKTDSLGNIFVHIIDTKTGYNKPSAILSASVIAPNCAIADAYATAFMAMPFKQSKKLVEEDSTLESYLIYSDSTNAINVYASKGFKALLLE